MFNLGSGRGYSVREVVATVERVTSSPVPVEDGPRRAGDCAALVSGSQRAAELLNWKAKSSLEDMIATAWAWHQRSDYNS